MSHPDPHQGERGSALLMLAGALSLLIGMAAFGIDLGWLLVRAGDIQRGADAAALAGVVHLPVAGNAATEAWDVAAANGFNDTDRLGCGDPGNSMADGVEVCSTPLSAPLPRLQVEVSAEVETFFLKVFGFDSFTISKEAVAEFSPPLDVGGAGSSFGYIPGGNRAWAAINAPYTRKDEGDAFASRCTAIWSPPPGTPATAPCASPNTEFLTDLSGAAYGYYYIIDASAVGSFTVEIFDAAFVDRRGSLPNPSFFGDPFDYAWDVSSPPSGSGFGPQATRYRVYAADATPFNHLDNTTEVCNGSFSRTPPPPPPVLPGWTTLCTVSDGPGIYPMRVTTEGNGYGTNQYGIRISAAGPVSITAVESMSLFVPVQDGFPILLPLARIGPEYAGKTVLFEVYDPDFDRDFDPPPPAGGGSDPSKEAKGRISIVTPDIEPVPKDDCDRRRIKANGDAENWKIGENCRVDAEDNRDGEWWQFRVRIPSTYTCSGSCLWFARYNLREPSGETAHDRTTWRVRAVVDPVHLVFDAGP